MPNPLSGGFGNALYANWRQEALDALEEVVAGVALAKAFSNHDDIQKLLELIQRKLLTIGFALENKISPKAAELLSGIGPADTEGLRNCISYFQQQLGYPTQQPLAAQNKAGAMLTLAHLFAKRGARKLQPVADMEEGGELITSFIDQLVTLLPILERIEYKYSNLPEKSWHQ